MPKLLIWTESTYRGYIRATVVTKQHKEKDFLKLLSRSALGYWVNPWPNAQPVPLILLACLFCFSHTTPGNRGDLASKSYRKTTESIKKWSSFQMWAKFLHWSGSRRRWAEKQTQWLCSRSPCEILRVVQNGSSHTTTTQASDLLPCCSKHKTGTKQVEMIHSDLVISHISPASQTGHETLRNHAPCTSGAVLRFPVK